MLITTDRARSLAGTDGTHWCGRCDSAAHRGGAFGGGGGSGRSGKAKQQLHICGWLYIGCGGSTPAVLLAASPALGNHDPHFPDPNSLQMAVVGTAAVLLCAKLAITWAGNKAYR